MIVNAKLNNIPTRFVTSKIITPINCNIVNPFYLDDTSIKEYGRLGKGILKIFFL